MSAAIHVENLSLSYPAGLGRAAQPALIDLDLQVGSGEILGLLGPNGSGKTSLLRVLSGVLHPDSGQVRVLGLAPRARGLSLRVGMQADGPLPLPQLRGLEFLQYMGELSGLAGALTRERAQALWTRFDLTHAGKKQIRQYSTGMRRRLALAAALLGEPEVLLLDEPTAGLDPDGSLLVMDILGERARAGCAVLMASHHLQEVEQICDRVVLIRGGRCLAEGSLDALLGTGATNLQIAGLDAAGLAAVRAAVEQAGGRVLGESQEREHIFALFRRLPDGPRA